MALADDAGGVTDNETAAQGAYDAQQKGFDQQIAQLNQEYEDKLNALPGKFDVNNALHNQYFGPKGAVQQIQQQKDLASRNHIASLRDPVNAARAGYYNSNAGAANTQATAALANSKANQQNATTNQQNATTNAERLHFDESQLAMENFVKATNAAHLTNSDELAKAQYEYGQLKDARDQAWDQYKERVLQDDAYTKNVLTLGNNMANTEMTAAEKFMPAEYGQKMADFNNALAGSAAPGAWKNPMPALPSAVQHLPFNPGTIAQDSLSGAAAALAHVSPMAASIAGNQGGMTLSAGSPPAPGIANAPTPNFVTPPTAPQPQAPGA